MPDPVKDERENVWFWCVAKPPPNIIPIPPKSFMFWEVIITYSGNSSIIYIR